MSPADSTCLTLIVGLCVYCIQMSNHWLAAANCHVKLCLGTRGNESYGWLMRWHMGVITYGAESYFKLLIWAKRTKHFFKKESLLGERYIRVNSLRLLCLSVLMLIKGEGLSHWLCLKILEDKPLRYVSVQVLNMLTWGLGFEHLSCSWTRCILFEQSWLLIGGSFTPRNKKQHTYKAYLFSLNSRSHLNYLLRCHESLIDVNKNGDTCHVGRN